MRDPMEYFRHAVRPVRGAAHTILSEREFASSLAVHHQRWYMSNPITGLPLAVVRAAEAEAHQGSRRVGPPATQRKGCNPWRIVYALRKRLRCSR